MRFSLLCATFGRSLELETLLASLANQSYRDFELVVIDQNLDDRVLKRLEPFDDRLEIRRLTSAPPGLSRALNLALNHVHGDVIGFPDDDCWYPSDLLQQLSDLFASHPEWDGITMPTADVSGKPSVARWSSRPGKVAKSNIGLRGCSTSIFYRRHVCAAIGRFDETVGADSGENAGFDIDYLHRVVRAGFHMQYEPRLRVGHPQNLPAGNGDDQRKRYRYGFAEGEMVRKYSVPLWYTGALVLFPFVRSVCQAVIGNRGQAGKEWLRFRGRLDGWLRTRPTPPHAQLKSQQE